MSHSKKYSPIEFKSVVPGMRWPALPTPRGCQLLALQFQLERSQWFAPETILEQQVSQLTEVILFAYRHVPFYRQRLDNAGLPPAKIQDPSSWRKIPLLSRDEIQAAGDQLFSNAPEALHGPTVSTFTSGSSGSPVRTGSTSLTRLMWNAFTLRQHLWHNRDLSLKLAAIRSLERGGAPDLIASHGNWGGATIDVAHTGPTVALDIHTDVDKQARWLASERPAYLITYPSNLRALIEHSTGQRIKYPDLIEVRTFGEILEPSLRNFCRQAWGVPIVDCYSSEEFGYLALQCPEHEHYHVMSEGVLLEVLREDGEPCQSGEIGRIVITSLNNFASPLIRYDIGDLAEVGDTCSCGRGLPVLTRIVGRVRQMAVLPNGHRIWPALILTPEAVREMPPVQQFQLIQRKIGEFELLLRVPRKLSGTEEAMMRQWVDKAVDHAVQTNIRYVDEIPRGQTGKYEDFRCEVPHDHDATS